MSSPKQVDRIVDEIRGELVALRRDLHAHPELGFEERRTSAIVKQRLEALGITYEAGLARGTGLLAHLPGGTEGARAVGLRADLDALPIQERASGRSHASIEAGKMHACGHDGHTTILVGVATVLARLAEQAPLPHPVTLLFQPAEEGGGGARLMVKEGCLDGSLLGPPLRRLYALHGWPELPLGTVATREGPLLAASDTFRLTIRGNGAHAGWPHVARDPVVAAAAVVTALQTVVSRNTDPLDALVLSITQIHGGTATNALPDEVELRGTLRSLLPEVRQLAHRRLEAVASGVARAHDCAAELALRAGYPPTNNNPEAAATVLRLARATVGDEATQVVDRPVMGAEDFAYYCAELPSCFFLLGLRAAGGDAPSAELHQPSFDFNDEALATGVRMLCRLALEG